MAVRAQIQTQRRQTVNLAARRIGGDTAQQTGELVDDGLSSERAGRLAPLFAELIHGGVIGYLSGLIAGGIAAALVMLIIGFFFATVSGYLVGVIGSSNNPISGLTLSTLVIAALLMVSMGVSGTGGVI